MCPDKQLLSVYHDGELPSPWKEKMAAHLQGCAACQAVVASYARLSAVLRTEAAEGPDAKVDEGLDADVKADAKALVMTEPAHDRVWARLSEQAARRDTEQSGRRRSAFPRFPRLVSGTFSRRIEVPLPVAAAAAVLVLVCAAFIIRAGLGGSTANPAAVAGVIDLEPEEIQQINTMGDALRFIEDNEFFSGVQGNYVIMRMPENRTFYSFSNPQIRNASGAVGGGFSTP